MQAKLIKLNNLKLYFLEQKLGRKQKWDLTIILSTKNQRSLCCKVSVCWLWTYTKQCLFVGNKNYLTTEWVSWEH